MVNKLILLISVVILTGCKSTLLPILDGATHAKGSIHLEGYATDSEGDVDLCKVPESYTPEQAIKYCQGE